MEKTHRKKSLIGSGRSPLVTVVMPAYNAGRFIQQAIESVLNQDFERFELIIVDDCSTDDTYWLAKTYAKDPRVRLYRNAKQIGNARTRNRILGLARGRYIAPLDSDDIMLSGRLGDHCRFLDSHPGIGVVFGKAIFAGESLRQSQSVFIPRHGNGTPFCRSGRVRALESWFNQGAAMIRKKEILRAGGYEESLPLGADSRLMRRLFKIAKFYFLNKFCFVYRWRRQSLCRRLLRKNQKAMAAIFRDKKPPRALTFLINGRWIKIRPGDVAYAKTLRWRLNHYAWQASKGANGADGRSVEWRIGEDAKRCGDAERFNRGFLTPFSKILAAENKIILNAGLVSKNEEGLLLIAEGSVLADVILSLLDRDYHYCAGAHTVLFEKEGGIWAEPFIEPLIVRESKMIRSGPEDPWGRFWNPLAGKFCLNVDHYRTSSIGSPCRVSALLFIRKNGKNGIVGGKKLDSCEAEKLMGEITNEAPGQSASLRAELIGKMLRNAYHFLLAAPPDRMGQAIAKFEAGVKPQVK